MNVKELIKELNKVENKQKEVYVWSDEFDRRDIYLVDEISDCVDLNIEIEE